MQQVNPLCKTYLLSADITPSRASLLAFPLHLCVDHPSDQPGYVSTGIGVHKRLEITCLPTSHYKLHPVTMFGSSEVAIVIYIN